MGANERITWWQEVRGTAAVIRNLEASRAATERLSRANLKLGASQEVAQKRGFLLNQVLFTGRRFLYAGTLAVGAFTTAMVALGFQFNLTMESNRVALTHFLGSAKLTEQELQYLYKLAATTPFEFGDLTTSTRKFLAFGFSLRQTNKYMKVIGDTVAGIGGSSADIEGLVTVFGQIQATGRVMGQDMLQLSQRGIPALQILKRELHLTNDQMAHMGDLAIPASVAIPALMRGMNKVFHGAAAEQAKTLQGQLSTLHDYASQLMGTLTLPLFNRFRTKIIPQLNSMVQEMQKAAKAGASPTQLVGIVDAHLKAGGKLVNMYKAVSGSVEVLRNLLVNGLLPTMYVVGQVFQGIYLVILPVLGVLKFLTRQQWLLMAVMIPIVTMLSIEATLYLAVKAAQTAGLIVRIMLLRWTSAMIIKQALYNWIQLITAIRTKAVTRAEVSQFLMQMKLFRVLSLLIGGYKAWNAVAFASARASNGQFKAGYKNNSMLAKSYRLIVGRMIPATIAATAATWAWVASIWASTVALLANPLTWVVLAVLALVGGLVVLYFKWKAFHDIVDKVWHVLDKYKFLALFLGPVITPIVIAIRVAKDLWKWGNKLYELFRHPLRLKIQMPTSGGLARSFLKSITDAGMNLVLPGGAGKYVNPFHYFGAAGGVVPTTSGVLVGERGPEIIRLPTGANVHPLPQPAKVGGQRSTGAPEYIHLTTKINLDGRQLAEVVSQHRLDRRARR